MTLLLPDTDSLTVSRRPKPPAIPPLENGDRLSRDEFERRYSEASSTAKAELIEGVVYMSPAALSALFHGIPHANLMIWAGNYRLATPGVMLSDNSTVRLDLDNDPQPDGCLYVLPTHGGRVRMSAEGYIDGAPDLVIEVSGSSVSIDMNQKLNAYRRNGVKEYLVFRTYDAALDWFILRGSAFEPLPTGADGIIKSETFPGLWLRRDAMIAGDMTAVMAALQQGTASPEHADYVKRITPAAGA